jgi:uncharacterized membrane protein YgcG
MSEFLKRHKIKDRTELRNSLIERGQREILYRDCAEFDSVLSTIVTQEMLSPDLSSHVEPSIDVASVESSSSFDTGGGFDGGGGISGGDGADGSWYTLLANRCSFQRAT